MKTVEYDELDFEAYLRGAEARLKRFTIEANPFKWKNSNERLFNMWRKGWIAEDVNMKSEADQEWRLT